MFKEKRIARSSPAGVGQAAMLQRKKIFNYLSEGA
jgi:hypothetical protein